MEKKTTYQVTIGYQGVICTNVNAKDEAEAKIMALERFASVKNKAFNNNKLDLQADSYGAYGVLDMDNTWHKV